MLTYMFINYFMKEKEKMNIYIHNNVIVGEKHSAEKHQAITLM